MTKEQILASIDIGTSYVRVLVAQQLGDEKPLQVIGVGKVPSAGVRHGMIVDIDETVKCINEAVEKAEKITGVPIEECYVSIGGNHIVSKTTKGVIAVSRADGEISNEDVNRVIDAASAISLPANREIIHLIPRNFTIDNQEAIKNPVGMNGVRLEVDALMIEGGTPFVKNLNKCLSEAGIGIKELILSALAASRATLTKRQKELGVMILDMGGGTTSMCVYEEGDIIHLAVLPIGGASITNDLAIGLKTSIDVAERVKLEYGSATPMEINKKDQVDLSKISQAEEGVVSRRKVAEIIEARIQEILGLCAKELKKIGRMGLLPAGVVLTGGGAKMPGVIDLAKIELGLPVQIGFPMELEGVVEKIDDPSFATSVGLILWGKDFSLKDQKRFSLGLPNLGINSMANTVGKIRKWFKAFLP